MCFIGTQNSTNLSHGCGAAWLCDTRHFTPQGKQEEDTKDTAQFEHVDSEQGAVAEQEQETAEKDLHHVMATLQEYCPARRSQMAMCTSRRPFGHPEWPNAPEDGPAF